MIAVRALVMALVLLLLCSCQVSASEEELWGWPLPESLQVDVEEWFGNPARKAINGVPKLLLNDTVEETLLANGEGGDGLWWVYLPSTNGTIVNNPQCIHDVKAILDVLSHSALSTTIMRRGHLWPITVPDSWGKLPDGILYGNFQPWGLMEECTAVRVHDYVEGSLIYPEVNATFNGKYCLVKYRYTWPEEGHHAMPDPHGEFTTKGAMLGPQWRNPRIGLLFPPIYQYFFSYGTCMPDSCSAEDLKVTLNHYLEFVGKEVRSVDCYTLDEQRETFTSSDIAFIVVFSVLGFLLVLGAIVDICINFFDVQNLRKGPLAYLLAFSAYSNMNKIFAINTKKNPEVISCLTGIRVLSMTWVVWCHSYVMTYGVAMNKLGVDIYTDDLIEQTITNATFSVDSFFFISGLLVAYGIMREYSRVGHVNWVLYYVHRFIRLAPPIALTGAAMGTVARFLLAGPFAKTTERGIVHSCQEYWWVDLLFATNFIDTPCLGQCWYTAVDTQIYIVLPLFLIPVVYTSKIKDTWSTFSKKIGLAWLAAWTLISFLIPTILFAVYNHRVDIMFVHMDEPATKTIDTYMTPWCRANAYLVGVWGGLLIHYIKGKNFKMNWWHAVAGWVAAASVALSIVYGLAKYNTLDDFQILSPGLNAFYGGFSRGAWAACLLWVVFACHTGYGGAVNSFLSHPAWQPLSRLTYVIFLVSIPIQMMYQGFTFVPEYFNHLNMVIQTCGFMFISGIVGTILSLMTEGPVLGLEKLLLKRPGRGLGQEQKTSIKQQ